MQENNNRKQRRIGLIITLIINLIIVGYIAITEFHKDTQDIQQVSVRDIRLLYLVFGIACFFFAAFMDYSKYRRMIMVAEGRDDRRGALECALLGKYYDNVTPFGAGGQPFQIHYLKKRGYTAGTSGAAPMVSFLTQQIAFVLIGLVVFISNRKILDSILLIRISAYVGLVMYALLPLGILTFAVFPKPFMAVIGWFIRLGGKLRLIKDVEKTSQSVHTSLNDYIKCIRLFKRRPIFFAKLIFLSTLYQVAILSIPFFMLRAFGGSGDWWTTFSLVVYIYAAITIIPTPGNAGAAEGSFYAVFSSLEGGMLFWAMIAWRVLVYYSWLICGLIVIARSTVSGGRGQTDAPQKEGQLRIALFIDAFFPTVDGLIRTVDAYARHLRAKGQEVFVVCPQQEGADYSTLPYPVYTVPSVRMPGFHFRVPVGAATRELKKLFAESTPDVIHVHSPFFGGRLALRLGKKYHIPVVATFHSKYYDDARLITHSKLLAKITVNYVVDFFAKADYAWACSPATAQTLRSYGYNGEIYVMENGVELSAIPAQTEALRKTAVEAFSLPENRKTLLFAGPLIWQKNLRLILDTMKLLVTADPSYLLILAGEGYHSDAIAAYAKELGLDSYVRFLGAVKDSTLLYGLYSYADLLFFPSLYDNAPLVLREAAAAGLPALLAEGSNSAEVVRDGTNGYTAEATCEAMAARVQKIFAEGNLAAVGEAARKTIPIDWSEIVDRVLLSYRTGAKEGHRVFLDIPKAE